MATNTPNLNLLKKHPADDQNDTFNIDTMLNDNWDKIDEAVADKVDKIIGLGLSSNDYTDEEKSKLSSIEESANNYIHPSTHSMDMITESDTKKIMTTAERTKLAGIEVGSEVNNISDANVVDLTDGGDSSLHHHSSDRSRANHTGTQPSSTISNFAAAVRATVLTGLATTTNTAITATDTILSALGKLQAQINSKANSSHNHDSRYYTESEINTKLNGKSNTNHNHSGVYEPANGNIVKKNINTTLAARFTAQSNTAYTTKQIRNVTLSTADPSGGSNGDVWIKYDA